MGTIYIYIRGGSTIQGPTSAKVLTIKQSNFLIRFENIYIL